MLEPEWCRTTYTSLLTHNAKCVTGRIVGDKHVNECGHEVPTTRNLTIFLKNKGMNFNQ